MFRGGKPALTGNPGNSNSFPLYPTWARALSRRVLTNLSRLSLGIDAEMLLSPIVSRFLGNRKISQGGFIFETGDGTRKHCVFHCFEHFGDDGVGGFIFENSAAGGL